MGAPVEGALSVGALVANWGNTVGGWVESGLKLEFRGWVTPKLRNAGENDASEQWGEHRGLGGWTQSAGKIPKFCTYTTKTGGFKNYTPHFGQNGAFYFAIFFFLHGVEHGPN
jgi:hypothetical protein